ncbi:MAG TPA: MazG nucleotide pyrophosphohydrolase domain-containing protein, partial [Nevskiaceae bacterium]
ECQRVAALEGFDWADEQGLWQKLDEEITELRAARNDAERAEEIGDLLFMVVNVARHLAVDPAAGLDAATRKFRERFAHVMAGAEDLPPLGSPARLAAMEARWQAAKRLQHRGVEAPARRSRDE